MISELEQSKSRIVSKEMGSVVVNSSKNHDQIAIVMVPFPAQGHLNQFLHLARLISSYNIPIHYVGFNTVISQAKARIHGWDLATATNYIHFQEFPTPSSFMSSTNCSDHNSTEAISKLIASVLDASLTLREPVTAFIKNLSSTTRRVVVIYDSMMASTVQDAVASIKHAEAYCFHAVSAFSNSSLLCDVILNRLHLPSFLAKLAKKFLLPSGAYIPEGLPTLKSTFTPEFTEFMRLQHSCNKFSSGNLYDTCKVLEGPYLETLARFNWLLGIPKQWAVGPFNPVTISGTDFKSSTRHECLEWLDKQGPNSVILVSFGTTTSLSTEQIKELAIGLEKSQQKFIWVVRDAMKGEGEVQIPKGYEDRVKERGIIVKDWAPQLEILAHKSTGGFMSHCGWNSCMESITMGVPIATWPIQFDQPRNAIFVTGVLKIGVIVKHWDRHDDIIDSTTIKNSVKKLMASEEGHGMRMRAIEFGKEVRESVKDGGDHQMEMDSFIAHVTRY